LKGTTIFRLSVYFVTFVLPILSAMNCPSYSAAGSISASSCYVKSELLASLADVVYGALLISSFLIFIPILIYIGIVVAVTEITAKLCVSEHQT